MGINRFLATLIMIGLGQLGCLATTVVHCLLLDDYHHNHLLLVQYLRVSILLSRICVISTFSTVMGRMDPMYYYSIACCCGCNFSAFVYEIYAFMYYQLLFPSADVSMVYAPKIIEK